MGGIGYLNMLILGGVGYGAGSKPLAGLSEPNIVFLFDSKYEDTH